MTRVTMYVNVHYKNKSLPQVLIGTFIKVDTPPFLKNLRIYTTHVKDLVDTKNVDCHQKVTSLQV